MSANNREERLLRLRMVKEYIPLSTAGIYKKMAEGRFPKQHNIGGTAFWKLSEIQEYIEKGNDWIQKQ
ncbi:MAG: AlpA family phage regulatory protein [Arcobacteraceae bacterium]|nr:AlpA family phage regulatory protein [Arcobacteraceae bacterium]